MHWGTLNGDFLTSEAKIASDGSIYLVGKFSGGPVDLNPTSTTTLSTNSSGQALIKLSPSFDFQWALEWSSAVKEMYIEVGSDNGVYVGGTFAGSADLDPTPTVNTKTSNGNYDAFLVKLNSVGDTAEFVYTWGGNGMGYLVDSVNGIDVDDSGNVFVGGQFDTTTDFDPTGGTYSITNTTGNIHSYISKFDSSGAYVWTKAFETSSSDATWPFIKLYELEVDSEGNVYSIGDMRGTDMDFDPSGSTHYITTVQAGAFVTRVNADGSFGWAKKISSNDEYTVGSGSLVIDSNNNVYVGGKYKLVVLNPEFKLVNMEKDIFEVKEGSVLVLKEDLIVRKV